MSSPLSRLFDAARRRLLDRGARPIPKAEGRRQFVRQAGAGALAVGTGLMFPDEAWAGIEERAARFGITPGTVVDAQGRRLDVPATSEPYLGEIMLFGGTFAVRAWAVCNGALLAINSNQSLYSLLGTTYGGDGRTTFAIPDLRGRIPVGFGQGAGLADLNLGQRTGSEAVTLTTANLAPHSHTLPVFNAPGSSRSPGGNVLAGDATGDTIYAPTTAADATLAPTASTGAGQAFNVMSPTLAISFQIAMAGIFPSRN